MDSSVPEGLTILDGPLDVGEHDGSLYADYVAYHGERNGTRMTTFMEKRQSCMQELAQLVLQLPERLLRTSPLCNASSSSLFSVSPPEQIICFAICLR